MFRALALRRSEALLRRRANARKVSTSFLPYGGITYLINSFDYPNLLFQFPTDAAPVSLETIPTILEILYLNNLGKYWSHFCLYFFQ